MTEKEKMLSSNLYNHTDLELTNERDRASDLMHRYNLLSEKQQSERKKILNELLDDLGENIVIKPPFMVDYEYFLTYYSNTWYTCAVNIQGSFLLRGSHNFDP